MLNDYDFSCYIIKYDRPSINGKTYKKDSLKNNDGTIVPLLWNHDHYAATMVLGQVLLEHRDDGVYIYGKFNDSKVGKEAALLLSDDSSLTVWVSPYINKVKIDEKYILGGIICEVSLVLDRCDPDDAYIPKIVKEKT